MRLFHYEVDFEAPGVKPRPYFSLNQQRTADSIRAIMGRAWITMQPFALIIKQADTEVDRITPGDYESQEDLTNEFFRVIKSYERGEI